LVSAKPLCGEKASAQKLADDLRVRLLLSEPPLHQGRGARVQWTAKRVYERLGFKTVGRLRGANLLNNRRYDEIIMDLLRSEIELKHVARFQALERVGA
jgi:hypothetical protein